MTNFTRFDSGKRVANDGLGRRDTPFAVFAADECEQSGIHRVAFLDRFFRTRIRRSLQTDRGTNGERASQETSSTRTAAVALSSDSEPSPEVFAEPSR